jgi:hypothetical protein
MGHSKRIKAESLKQLANKLARINIRIGESELNRQRKQIDEGRTVVIWATKTLSQNEVIKKSMRSPYIGNPFRRVNDTERVQLRVTFLAQPSEGS